MSTKFGDPSLKYTVYVVPTGLFAKFVTKKVSTAGMHCKMVDPFV